MKKTLILSTLLAIFLLGANSKPTKLYRLTIINKSGFKLGLRLTGQDYENFYYLQVPAGDRNFPTEERFTILANTYFMQTYYSNPTNPVYPGKCTETPDKNLIASRNIRITFTPCYREDFELPGGEPSMVKYPWVGDYIY